MHIDQIPLDRLSVSKANMRSGQEAARHFGHIAVDHQARRDFAAVCPAQLQCRSFRDRRGQAPLFRQP
jgi:hypothetical protein